MGELSHRIAFKDADWSQIPASPGAYVIYDNCVTNLQIAVPLN